jgi:hypothetical protein
MRVTAPTGFVVSCGDDELFAAACELGGMPGNSVRALRVRLDDDAAADAAGTLRVFHGPDRYTVGLEARSASGAGEVAGAYRGFARLTRLGVAAASDEVPLAPASDVVPLTAELFLNDGDDGPGVLVIHDEARVLHPDGELVASVDVSTDSSGGEVSWPSFVAYDGVALAGLESAVVASPAPMPFTLRGLAPTLSVPLDVTYVGVGEQDRHPRAVFDLVLSRVAALDEGAAPPPVPSDAPSPPTGRRDETSTWADAVAAVLAPSETLAPGEAAGFFRAASTSNLNLCASEGSAAAITDAAESFYGVNVTSAPLPASELATIVSPPVLQSLLGALGEANVFRPIVEVRTEFSSPDTYGAFPCQLAPAPFSTCGASDVQTGVIQLCSDIAATYGCTVERVDDAEATLSLTVVQDFGGMVGSTNCSPTFLAPVDIPVQVQRVCTVTEPLAPTTCAELTLCYETAEALNQAPDETHASTQASLLSAVPEAGGDLRCATGQRSAGLADAKETGALFDVFTACLEDLEGARSALVTTPSFDNGAGVDALFGGAGCLDAARFAFALRHATAPARRVPGDPVAAADPAALALAHRLLQSWLTLHGLVAREAMELDPLLPLLELQSELDPAVAFDLSVDGWALLLHPRVFDALEALPDSLVYAPDYRPLIAPGAASLPNADAQVGLAPMMIETLDAQAGLLLRLMERAHREGQLGRGQNVLDDLAELRRTEIMVRAIASDLVTRAKAHRRANNLGPAAWIDRYLTSSRAYQGTLRKLDRVAANIALDRNPLGIEDADLPLYFLGDEASASSRFTAISDFLLGVPGSPTAWAPRAVQDADAALVSARSAGLSLQGREFERAISAAEQAQRLDDIRRSFGSAVISYCGLPDGTDPLDVLESWPTPFSAESCFLNRTSPECAVPVEAYERAMTLDDVQYQFCVVRQVRELTAGGIGFLDPAYDGVAEELTDCPHLEYPAPCPAGMSGPCVKCDWSPPTLELVSHNALSALVRSGGIVGTAGLGELGVIDAPDIEEQIATYCDAQPDEPLCICRAGFADFTGAAFLEDAVIFDRCATAPVPPNTFTFQTIPGLAETPADVLEDARAQCGAAYPNASQELPTANDLVGQPPPDRSCYNGSLGEMALQLEAVSADINIARSEMAELHDAYDVAIRSCLIQQRGNDLLDATLEAHNRTMSALRKQKAEADKAAIRAEAVEDCASAVASVTNAFTGFAAAASCGASTVQADAQIRAVNLERRMADAEAGHAALMQQIEGEIEEQLCFNDAELHLVSVRTASLRVQRAAQQMGITLYQFEQAKSSAQTAYDAGRAALAIAAARLVRPPAHDFWFDESVDTYRSRMRIARRLVYLATRAVEYEFQASLTAREAALAAEIPGDLEGVLNELRSIAATRSIEGSRPADLKIVLSLRDQILQLGDLSLTQPEGWHRLTDRDRFRLLLRSQNYATYDDDGVYVGQTLPFSLAPLGALGLGEEGGVQVFAANDCAERLWDVNASVIGDDLLRGIEDASFIRIDLLKSNTFYSQWCAGDRDDPFQAASVRPSRNLFREPSDEVRFGETLARSDEGVQMSRARIEAYINVDRAGLEADAFASGATSELAARGLYGEYALFLPAGVLSGSPDDDGLVLDRVDDILIRLDYVSVAR